MQPHLGGDRADDPLGQRHVVGRVGGEGGKVAVRNVRRDAMDYIKKLKKNSEITEDDQKKAEKDLQELTDKYIKKVDEACAVKEKELMEL